MTTPPSVDQHYRDQQRLIVSTLALTRATWQRMNADFDAAWRTVGPLLVAVTGRAQLAAATSGAGYIPRALLDVGLPDDPVGRVEPQAFAGVASDGRPLAGLLRGAVVQSKAAVGNGLAGTQALAQGGRWLDQAVHTQVADAGRGAAQVGITARPKLGWVRMLNPPSCSRCVILAGKWFAHNTGFQRHPRCDCRHIPATEGMRGDFTTDPGTYFSSLSEAEQDRTFTKAGAQAVRDGADLNRVVNSRRGMDSSSARLDQIYARADSREEAQRLLFREGFLTTP